MANQWVEHVKAYAKKHNLKYGEAMKQAKASYNPSGSTTTSSTKTSTKKKKGSGRSTPTSSPNAFQQTTNTSVLAREQARYQKMQQAEILLRGAQTSEEKALILQMTGQPVAKINKSKRKLRRDA